MKQMKYEQLTFNFDDYHAGVLTTPSIPPRVLQPPMTAERFVQPDLNEWDRVMANPKRVPERAMMIPQVDMGMVFTVTDDRTICANCYRYSWTPPDDYICEACRG